MSLRILYLFIVFQAPDYDGSTQFTKSINKSFYSKPTMKKQVKNFIIIFTIVSVLVVIFTGFLISTTLIYLDSSNSTQLLENKTLI